MYEVYKMVNDLWIHEGTFVDIIALANCMFWLGRCEEVQCVNVKRVEK